MNKLLLLTLNEQEEKVIDKIIWDYPKVCVNLQTGVR